MLDAFAATVTSILETFDDPPGGLKGFIRLVHRTDASKWLLFTVSTLSSPAGYKNITVACIGFSTASPFVDGDPISLCFDPMGAVGAVQDFDLTPTPRFVFNFNDTLLDASGNALDLTVTGTTRFTEFWPGCRGLLVWTDSSFGHATDALLNIPGDLTLECIIRLILPTSTQIPTGISAETHLIRYAGAGDLEAANSIYQLSLVNGTAPHIYPRSFSEHGAGLDDLYDLSASTSLILPQIGQPFHLAMTRIGNVIQFYLNGRPYGPASSTLVTPTGGTTSTFQIGNGAQAFVMKGCRGIPSGLSAAQILASYNRTMGPAFGFLG